MAEKADLTKLFTNANITPLPNDNEIIKAWEKILKTGDAPIGEHWSVGGIVTTKLAKETYDMLNRQKAEIERLQKAIKVQDIMIEQQDYKLKQAKSEAIKGVLLKLEAEAESSDKYIREYEDSKEQRAYNQALWKACNLVKEMVGE